MARSGSTKSSPPAVAAGQTRPRALEQPRLDEIAARAHEIYLARGAAPGQELADWLQAERELCFPGLQD